MGFVCVSVHLLEFLKRVLLREEMDFLFIFGYAFPFVVIWALIKKLNKREQNSLLKKKKCLKHCKVNHLMENYLNGLKNYFQ